MKNYLIHFVIFCVINAGCTMGPVGGGQREEWIDLGPVAKTEKVEKPVVTFYTAKWCRFCPVHVAYWEKHNYETSEFMVKKVEVKEGEETPSHITALPAYEWKVGDRVWFVTDGSAPEGIEARYKATK